MFRRYRQRRGPYALAQPSPVPSIIRTLILLLVAAVILYFIGRGIFKLFNIGNGELRSAVNIVAEGQGTVNVSLEGGLLQRVTDKIPLYEDDKVSAGSNGHARLSFLDTTMMRTDVNTDVTIGDSATTEDSAMIGVELTKGSLWVKTPALATYSGTILRTITDQSIPAGPSARHAGGCEGAQLDGLQC